MQKETDRAISCQNVCSQILWQKIIDDFVTKNNNFDESKDSAGDVVKKHTQELWSLSAT